MRVGVQKSYLSAGFALAALLGLSACGGVSETFGFARNSPDEFNVITKAPLVVPPDLTLRPPTPGAPRPQEVQPVNRAQEALFGRRTQPNPEMSEGENVLLARAGALQVDPSVRELVDRDNEAAISKPDGFIDRVLFWQRGDDDLSESE
ncbi:MAG: DUF3035 domain-containing protein [Alphaproteobacteria bacterium]